MPRAGDLSLRDQVRLLSGAGVWTTRAVPGVPSVRMNDGPHGMRVQLDDGDHLGLTRSEPATCFPPAVTLGSTWDEELVAEVGAAVAEEAKALGVSLVLGPGLNIKRHPLCGRNFEYFSEDPLVSGRMAAAFVTGLQSRGIGACVKHFAANNQENRRFVSDSVVDERTLREIYLSAFEHVVTTATPWAVMASYNLLNGVQVTEDRRLLTEILREEWGFDGLVVSDWGATADRVRGIRAGLDLEMPGGHQLSDGEVRAAVHAGELSDAEVGLAAQRVIDHVARCPELTADPRAQSALVETHDALARRVAAAGAVLLANDGVLPLDEGVELAVIGAFAEAPRYQGGGSSLVNAARVTTLHGALTEAGVRFAYAPGYDPRHSVPDAALIAEAVEVAAAAEVAVVMVGLPGIDESEGFDRDHLDLPRQHDDLVRAVAAANPRTVVVLSNGAPVLMPWRDEVAAVLETHLGGQAGGGAVADLLFGRAEPGGRLAESFPHRQSDVGADPWFPGVPRQVEYREGLFVGYRHHTSAGIAPMWPFGHGLGYTTFEWDQARVSQALVIAGEGVSVTVRVTNTGERPGSDVVQVYRRDESGVVLRPLRELVGFARVQLAAGESRVVQIRVPGRGFAFHDTQNATWQVPDGRQVLEVARSSEDIVAELVLTVSGGVDTAAEGPDVAPIAVEEAAFVRRLGHPVPAIVAVRPFTRGSTIEEIATTRIGALFRAALVRAVPAEPDADPGTQQMVTRSLEELPLRAAASFASGALSWAMVDLLLDLLNGKPVSGARRGLGLLVGAGAGLVRGIGRGVGRGVGRGIRGRNK